MTRLPMSGSPNWHGIFLNRNGLLTIQHLSFSVRSANRLGRAGSRRDTLVTFAKLPLNAEHKF